MAYLTEEEAKTKWCPYSDYDHQRQFPPHPTQACCASNCMMWNWHKTNVKYSELSAEDLKMSGRANPNELVPASRTYGFCGIAGEAK